MTAEALSENQTLVSRCHSTIRDLIVDGTFSPGEKLKVGNLARLLETGPTPIREALSRLASTGLITASDNKGFRVKEISEAEARDLYFAFAQIERIALKRAIELGTPQWEGEVVAALHRLSLIEKQRSPKFLEWLHANEAFHATLISACGSPILLKVRNDIYQLLVRYTYLSFQKQKKALEHNNSDHQKIAKAAIGRDGELACKLMDAHLSGSIDFIIKDLKTLIATF